MLTRKFVCVRVWWAFLFATVFFVSVGHSEDAADKPPRLPTEVHLTSGAVLHHVSVIRWGAEQVVLKHSGGADPIRYANMGDDDRTAFEAARDFYTDHPPVREKPVEAPSTKVSGQAFVQTVGAGPSKLGAMRVYAFPLSALDEFDTYQDTINLPHPLASALTDADGRFKLTIPGDDPFFIFAEGSRTIGGHTEFYSWRIKSDEIEDRQNLLLQNENMKPPTGKNIVIAD